MFKHLREDVAAIRDRDPAARSWAEVLLCYPGLHAVLVHRIASWCWHRGLRLPARFLSHVAKVFTGVEIHPGARIGRRVFIDHATGVVIGETAEVGDDCTLYQGVTLGGTSLEKGKRHPTLEEGVIVGSGAQILGPIVVGAGARIGANAVVLRDVPEGATMVGIPARVAARRRASAEDEFCAYGTPRESLPDPVARAFDGLTEEIVALRKRIEELEDRSGPGSAAPAGPEPGGKRAAIGARRTPGRPRVVTGGKA